MLKEDLNEILYSLENIDEDKLLLKMVKHEKELRTDIDSADSALKNKD